MKIACFTRSWITHRAVGGLERSAFSYFKGLADRGHEVHVFTTVCWGKATICLEDGMYVHYLEGTIPGRYSDEYFHFADIAFNKIGGFHVILSKSYAARNMCGGKTPVVASWSGLAYCSWRSKTTRAGMDISIEELPSDVVKEIPLVQKYDLSIAPSHVAYQDLINIYQIPKEKVRLIFNAYNTNQFHRNLFLKNQMRARLGIPNSAFVMGAAGRLVKDKGHHDIIVALPYLLNKYPDFYFIVAGNGSIKNEYMKLSSERIKIIGSLDYRDMPEFYNSLDIFINPTRRHEGLDRVIHEAMLCGVPLVTSKVGSIYTSILYDERFGRTFEVGNLHQMTTQIETLFNGRNESWFDQMKIDAATWSENNLATEEVSQQLENALNEAISLHAIS